MWDLESGAQIGDDWRDEENKTGVWTMSLSPNGKTVASGNVDGTVRLWDVETGMVISKWRGHTQTVQSVCWSPNGERVVSGSFDGTAKVWDVESGEPVLALGLNPIQTGHESVYAVSYSPNATKIATGGYKETAIKIWNANTGELLSTIKHEWAWSLTWTSDGRKLISGSGNGSIRIFDTATWQQISSILEGHQDLVYTIAVSRNERLLASASWDGTVRLWNLDTNLPIGPPLQHENLVFHAAFSSDGKLLTTACADKNAYVWDIYAILNAVGLEDILSIPHKSSPGPSELEHTSRSSQDTTDKSFLDADATGELNDHDADQLPPGFFDYTQDDVHTSATRDAHAHSSAHWLPPSALLARLTSLLRHSRSDTAEQPPVPSKSRSRALLSHLSSLLHRFRPDTGETLERQQPPVLPESSSHIILGRLTSLLSSPSNAAEGIELQQWPRQTTSSHCSPHVVEVSAMRDKQALYVSRRPETASEQANRIKNPTTWHIAIVLTF
ncbi:WD40-repeat-containing domain protein [Suillus clintonianus]|uniref:WD40-repeat-containing domain protein n=1 Tax=Suillus clintonianus TaxID=1904413 RepID=UPI001B87BF17|nr:WD40-repeat-containing domain protein [Suillus clintonianus]KAG2111119.1 WD40-repeat-containing domain protein [Suillus clintonianus]